MTQQLHFEKHLLGGSARSLKLAFIVDPLDHLKAWKDTSVAMMRAAETHGHEVLPSKRRAWAGAAPNRVSMPAASMAKPSICICARTITTGTARRSANGRC